MTVVEFDVMETLIDDPFVVSRVAMLLVYQSTWEHTFVDTEEIRNYECKYLEYNFGISVCRSSANMATSKTKKENSLNTFNLSTL